MTERDRLKKLLDEAFIKSDDNHGMPNSNQVTDYLVANGVVVLPCKVGDTIYRCGDLIKKVYEWEIEHIKIYFDEIVFVDDSDNVFTDDDIGKTVFLTREEAEKALEEMRLATEANKILEKYEYSSDYSHHTVTCMSRAKTLGKEFLQCCSFLYTKEEKKGGEK